MLISIVNHSAEILDEKLHAAVGAHLAAAEKDQRPAPRARARGAEAASALAADPARARARRARVHRVRAAITASAVSKDLRQSLWKE